MSSITPADHGGFSYAMTQRINEIEDDIDLERKKLHQNTESEIESMQRKTRESIQKVKEQAAATVDSLREDYNQRSMADRASIREEMANLKKQTYDRNGRYSSRDAEDFKAQRDSSIELMNDMTRQTQDIISETERNYSEKAKDLRLSTDRQMEESTQKIKESLTETISQQNKAAKAIMSEQEKRHQDDKTNLHRENTQDSRFRQRASERMINQIEESASDRITKAEKRATEATKDRNVDRKLSLEVQAKTLRDAHVAESDALRNDLKELISREKLANQELGRARQELISEIEGDWRARERSIIDGMGAEIDKLKLDAQDIEKRSSEKRSEAIKDKERHFTNLISRTIDESLRKEKDIEATFQRDREVIEDGVLRERERSRAHTADMMADLTQERERSLRNQAKAYQDTISRYRTQAEDQIHTLERELLRKSSPGDKTLISPAAEEELRAVYMEDAEKRSQAEKERHDATLDSLLTSGAKKLQQEIDKNQKTLTKMHQETQRDRQIERSEFSGQIQEAELKTETTLRNQETTHARQTELIRRNYAVMIDRLREQYEELLQAQSSEAQAKLSAVKQNAEFQSKITAREAANNLTDTITNYEKKLADQREESHSQLYAMKSTHERQLRDMERKTKHDLDNQSRGYEQRITQMEVQFKERENTIQRNFQDDLDKVKRTHAEILRKKG